MNKLLKPLKNGILDENPTLRLVLGTCPTIAITTAVSNGVGMGLAATFVLVGSNLVISLLRNFIPGKARIPALCGGHCNLCDHGTDPLMKAYLPALNQCLGYLHPAYRGKLHHPGQGRGLCQQKWRDALHHGRCGHGPGLYLGHHHHLGIPGGAGQRNLPGNSPLWGWLPARPYNGAGPRRVPNLRPGAGRVQPFAATPGKRERGPGKPWVAIRFPLRSFC